MTITVRLFAAARDLAGRDRASLPWHAGLTVAGVRELLTRQLPSLAPLIPRCILAVNLEFADESQHIHPGDEIALIPPVSGG